MNATVRSGIQKQHDSIAYRDTTEIEEIGRKEMLQNKTVGTSATV